MERLANRRLMNPSVRGCQGQIRTIHNLYRNEDSQMLNEDWIFRRGDIYVAELDARVGFVQSGTRPVIVLQNNCGNFLRQH